MERATREAIDPNLRHKPRLLSEEELPSWLLKDEDEVRNFYNNVKFHNIRRIIATTKRLHNGKY